MRAADRTDYIVQALMEAGAMYEDGARSFLAEHDADQRAEVLARAERYRIAWRMARTRARSAGSAADRYAARAGELQTALQDATAVILGMQMQRDAARAEVLPEITRRLASRATLYGDSTTVNRIIKDLLNLADEQPGKASPNGPTATQQPDECTCMPHRKLGCGHCLMDICCDCDHCPCSCTCNEADPSNIDDAPATERGDASPHPATQAPDFFQPDHTYRSGRTTFRCETISTRPTDGQRHALGWVMQYDRDDEAGSFGQDSWALGGWSQAHEGTDTCARCRHLFDPTDTSFDGRARQGTTKFCRRCVDRCHESEDAGHACPVCRPLGGEAR